MKLEYELAFSLNFKARISHFALKCAGAQKSIITGMATPGSGSAIFCQQAAKYGSAIASASNAMRLTVFPAPKSSGDEVDKDDDADNTELVNFFQTLTPRLKISS